jgi:hypothetical protein
LQRLSDSLDTVNEIRVGEGMSEAILDGDGFALVPLRYFVNPER